MPRRDSIELLQVAIAVADPSPLLQTSCAAVRRRPWCDRACPQKQESAHAAFSAIRFAQLVAPRSHNRICVLTGASLATASVTSERCADPGPDYRNAYEGKRQRCTEGV